MRPAVFLDRDGTLIEEMSYLDRLDRITLFPYSIDAVRLLNRAGFATIVVTNQSGIARGLIPESFVTEAHRYISKRLAAGGARIDAYYYCPHHPEGVVDAFRQDCDCRKPQPGMLRRAAADLGLDLSRSFSVGDRLHDLQAAAAAGARGILVKTGHGAREAVTDPPPTGGIVTDTLIGAVSWILHAS